MLFQSICPLSKCPSKEDLCEKCKVRGNSQSCDEMKSLNAKTSAKGRTAVVSPKCLIVFGALAVLVLFLFVTIQFLRTSGIYSPRNYNRQPFFANPGGLFFDSEYPEDSQTTGDNAHKFMINSEDICHADATDDVKLLILVTSFIGNFDHRRAIRDTWGSLTTKSGPYRLGFVVGFTMNATASRLLQEEYEMYHDIIQCNFEDTEQNLTLKSIAMLKWVTEFCPHTKFFLKANDDIYINFSVLSQIMNNETYLTDPNFITGFLQCGVYSEKETDAKDFLSEEDFSDEFHPPYISGSAYLTTGDLSKDLYKISNEIKPLISKEDVFITGVCAHKIGAALFHDNLFRSDKPNPTWIIYSSIATGNGLEPSEIYKIWKEMIDYFSDFDMYIIDS